DLTLADGKGETKPILEQMATLPQYIEPLKQFEKLIVYANVRGDPVINFGNAALSWGDACPKKAEESFKNHPRPHVFQYQ
ncbi:hypothetical protein HDU91_002797, partial [Kappamyces sp. JEL0680]